MAFVDRADIKARVGPPGALARYDILASCISELQRVGIVDLTPTSSEVWDGDPIRGEARIQTSPLKVSLPSAQEARLAAAGTLLAHPHDSAAAAAPQASPSSENSAAAVGAAIWRCAVASSGFSGRTLRKLPLAAHAHYMRSRGGAIGGGKQFSATPSIPAIAYTTALLASIGEERASRVDFKL